MSVMKKFFFKCDGNETIQDIIDNAPDFLSKYQTSYSLLTFIRTATIVLYKQSTDVSNTMLPLPDIVKPCLDQGAIARLSISINDL